VFWSGKTGFSPEAVRKTILRYHDTYSLIGTSPTVLLAATDLAVQHRLRIWNAVILAAAAEADCRLLLSEDLQDGLSWRGVTVVDPFSGKKNELLKKALNS
jgi:predicted nucleic acid-binding protein